VSALAAFAVPLRGGGAGAGAVLAVLPFAVKLGLKASAGSKSMALSWRSVSR
jgi:hypothetical protein